MNKIKELKELIVSKPNTDLTDKIKSIFSNQIEETTISLHLTLTKSQYEALGEDFNYHIFKNFLVSVELEGEIDFVHYCYEEDLESIKKNGILLSYSGKGEYIPDMGHGIYVVESDSAYDVTDEIIEFLVGRYDDRNEEVGYIEGTYKGKYIECIYGYAHEGHIVLKDNVAPDMITNTGTEFLSELAYDYYNYMDSFDF